MIRAGAALCARCGVNRVGYHGREFCWECVPRPGRVPLPICSRCGVNPVGYRRRDACWECVPRHDGGGRLCVHCGVNPPAYNLRDSCYECVPRQRRATPLCSRCGVNLVAYQDRETCYECVPRRRRAAPVCKRCGSGDYYRGGLCRRCHPRAALIDNCRDCLAWGVTRRNNWLCEACRAWRRRGLAEADCNSCGRHVTVNDRGNCRLCTRHATVANRRRPTHRALDVAELNRHGQQLFFAKMILKKQRIAPAVELPHRPIRWPARFPIEAEPLALFDCARELDDDYVRRLGPPPIPVLADALQQAVHDHGDRHGWSHHQRDATWRCIRILLTIQDAPGTRIAWSEVDLLRRLTSSSVPSVVDVLVSVGMFRDDQPRPLETWFNERARTLPEPMRHELTEWFHALRDGSTSAPRRKPRHIITVSNYTGAVLPTLHDWAGAGHTSLREITRDHIAEAVHTGGSTNLLSALRSLFGYLKARKLTFVNPTTRIRTTPAQPSVPLLVDLDPIREALHSHDAARAALTALVAFHALRINDLCDLRLIDVHGPRLAVGDHQLVFAEPVRTRLNTWLAERARRWPNSINPHLFIHSRTAGRLTAVTPAWVTIKIGTPPSTIRQDRILHEAFASGDPRRLHDLFGISIQTADRYLAATRPTDEHFTETPNTPGS